MRYTILSIYLCLQGFISTVNAQTPATSIFDGDETNGFKALKASLSAGKSQIFTAKADQKIEITAASGTKISLPAGSFRYMDWTAPKGDITLTVKEALTPADWLAYNLSTLTTEGDLLQTGGMVYVDAVSDGKPLRLNEGVSMLVRMPAFNGFRASDMQLFYGQQQASNSPVRWEIAPTIQSGTKLRQGLEPESVPPQTRIMDSLVRATLQRAIVPAIVPKMPKFSAVKLRIANSKPPQAPVNLRRPTAPTPPACIQKANALLSNREKSVRRDYQNKFAKYTFALSDFEQKWAKYREDSVSYANAKAYQLTCREQFEQYEDSMAMYVLAKSWNYHITPPKGEYATFEHVKQASSGRNFVPLNDYLHLYGLNDKDRKFAAYIKSQRRVSGFSAQVKSQRHVLGMEIPPAHSDIDYVKNSYKWYQFKKRKNSEWIAKKYIAWHQNGWQNRYEVRSTKLIQEWSGKISTDEKFEQQLSASASKNVDGLMKYSFYMTGLSWANIDRFLKMERTEKILANASDNTQIFMYCPSIQCALGMESNGKYFESPVLPANIPVKLIAIQLHEGNPSLCIQEVVTGVQKTPVTLVYRPVSLIELKESLEKI